MTEESDRERQLAARCREQAEELLRLRAELDGRNVAHCTKTDKIVATRRAARNGGAAPPALEGHTAVTMSGAVYIFGGSDGRAVLGDTWRLDPEAVVWAPMRHDDGPGPRRGHSAVVLDGDMVVHGGASASGGLLATTFRLSAATGAYTQVAPRSAAGITASKHHSAVVHGQCMYLFGGLTSSGRSDRVTCYDAAAGAWLDPADLNPQREGPNSASRRTAAPPSQAAEGSPDAVDSADQVPCARSSHTACVIGDRMIVFGGRGEGGMLNDTYSYSITARRWERLFCGGEIPPARCDHAAVIVGDSYYVFGGYSRGVEGGKVFHQDLYALTIATNTWRRCRITSEGSAPPAGCSRAALVHTAPDGTIGLLCHGGWLLSRRSGTYGASPRLWHLTLAKGDPPAQPSPHRASSARLERLARPRPPVQQPALPPPRPSTTCSSARRSTVRGGPIPTAPRPWVTKLTTGGSYFSEAGPPTAPPPTVRSQAAIEKATERLCDTRVRASKMAVLEKRYLFAPKTARLSAEEEEESVSRLYYAEREYREDRLRELDERFYPHPPTPDVTEDDVYEAVDRLSTPRPRPGTAATSAPADAAAAPRTLSAAEMTESVQRLYYEQQKRSREHRARLQQRYLWKGPVSPRRTSDDMHDLVDRLTRGEH